MYNGGLISFRIKDSDTYICRTLYEIDIDIDDKGALLKQRLKQKEDEEPKEPIIYGYIEKVVGIEIDEMMSILGYTKEDNV